MKKLFVVPLTVLLVLLVLFSLNPKGTFLSVVFAQTEGNILFVEVWQLEDSGYDLKANFTTTGGSVSVNGSKWFKFVVCHRFNSTLASSTSEAVDYTKILMNITSIWTNVELNNTSAVLSGDGLWYILKEEGYLNQTLAEGATYECTVLQQGYY